MICPYCAEEIKDEAIKCKHCGEFLDKSSFFKEAINTVSDYANETRSALEKRRLINQLTANGLFQIDSDLEIGDTYFLWKGKEYSYEGVTSVGGEVSVETLNFISVSDAYVSISHVDIEEGVFVDSKGYLVKGKSVKRIQLALPSLYKNTFGPRMRSYAQRLKREGSLSIPAFDETTIYTDGTICQGSEKVCISDAFKEGNYAIGFRTKDYGGLNTDRYEPRKIVLCAPGVQVEYKSLFGIKRSKGRIEFTPLSDFDVISAIIQYFGEE